MQWTSRFKADAIGEIAHWSDMRWPWALIIFLSCALVVLAHNVFRIDERSDKRFVYVTAFDNGDGRGLEQPPLPDMKYSRAVIFKIDQQKKTVEQVWEYGKEKGHDWYSPVTSLTQYEGDKDSVMVYSATPQMQLVAGKAVGAPSPYLMEFNWGAKEPAVEIRINGSMGYQAMPFRVNKAFNHTGK